jgi:DNA-binding transcriptional LysR family regulator
LQQTYPKLKVHLDLNDGISDLAEDSVDVAIRIGKPVPHPGLTTRWLARHERIICGSPDYFDEFGTPLAPADLARHDCLIFSYGGQAHQWRFRPLGNPDGSVQAVDVRGSLSVNNSEMLRQACLGGYGVALLPVWLVMEDVLAGRLMRILPNYEANPGPMDVGLYAVYPPIAKLLSRYKPSLLCWNSIFPERFRYFRSPAFYARTSFRCRGGINSGESRLMERMLLLAVAILWDQRDPSHRAEIG